MPLKKTIQPYGVPCNAWAKELKVANTAVFDWSGANDKNAAIPAIRLYNTDVKELSSPSSTRIGHVACGWILDKTARR